MDLGFLILGSIPGTEAESGAVLDHPSVLEVVPRVRWTWRCPGSNPVGAAGDVAPDPSGRQIIPGKGHHYTEHRGPTAPATWALPCPVLGISQDSYWAWLPPS